MLSKPRFYLLRSSVAYRTSGSDRYLIQESPSKPRVRYRIARHVYDTSALSAGDREPRCIVCLTWAIMAGRWRPVEWRKRTV